MGGVQDLHKTCMDCCLSCPHLLTPDTRVCITLIWELVGGKARQPKLEYLQAHGEKEWSW